MNLYLDGNLVGTTVHSSSFNNNLYGRITIGAEERIYNSNPFMNFFDGRIDEVSIWNKALSIQEIQQYMN